MSTSTTTPVSLSGLKDKTHRTQIGMYVLGAILVWRTPAKLVNR